MAQYTTETRSQHVPSKTEPRSFHSPLTVDALCTLSPQELVQWTAARLQAHPEPINGYSNPNYEVAAEAASTQELVADSVQHRVNSEVGKREQKERFQEDIEALSKRIDAFAAAFKVHFAYSALCREDLPFTPELVAGLRLFLHEWIPNWFPCWDHAPHTRFSHAEQVHNFANKTLQHVDVDMLYVRSYARAWNQQVNRYCSDPAEHSAAHLDENYLMCRALLHDLGRWFTQDSRAHEEIPAWIAQKTGLRRDVLTLDDGNLATHPRDFSPTAMSQKQLIRMIEFFSDFFSKPHHDAIWPDTMAYMVLHETLNQDPSQAKRAQELLERISQAEQLRQMELRHPDLAMMYFLFSARGYADTSFKDVAQWRSILQEKYRQTPERLEYFKTEARMLRDGMVFLQAVGLSPRAVRAEVQALWTTILTDSTTRHPQTRIITSTASDEQIAAWKERFALNRWARTTQYIDIL